MLRFFLSFFYCFSFFIGLNAHELGMITLFRDEGHYLKEWIEYHHMIGVDHFWLYNDRSTDNWEEVLAPYIESGLVEVISWNKPPLTPLFPTWQMEAFQDGIKRALGNTKWLAFTDLDEFIIPMKDKTITQCLEKRYAGFDAVYANWRNFGTGGVFVPYGQPLVTKLKSCSLRNHPRNASGKTIVKTEAIQADLSWSPHFHVIKPGAKYANGDGKEIPFEGTNLFLDGDYHEKYIRVNHYALRDENYFLNVRMPRAISREYGEVKLLEEHYKAFNLMSDSTIIRFIQEKHPEMYQKIWLDQQT